LSYDVVGIFAYSSLYDITKKLKSLSIVYLVAMVWFMAVCMVFIHYHDCHGYGIYFAL